MDMPYVFICHSHLKTDVEFDEFIKELKRGLFEKGIDCFIDHENLRGGDIWQEKIIKELERADCIFVVADDKLECSGYCGMERGFAYSRQIPELVLVHNKYKGNLCSFVNTQKLDKMEFTVPWWEQVYEFAYTKYNERKKLTHIEDVNAIVSAAPHLSGAQLNTVLKAIINPINLKLQPEYYGQVISIQKETQNSINVIVKQPNIPGGGRSE